MRTQNGIGLLVCSILTITVPAAFAEQAPSTQPATFTLRGKVRAAVNVNLESIDLSRAVIFLASDPILDARPLPSENPQVAQLNKAFVPNFLVVAKNTEVEFPNWDHFSHNVFSRSAAAPAFDLSRYPYGQSKSRKFDKTGVIQLFCNIHPYMKALIYVAPNPYFVRPGADGQFELKDVPAGKYELFAWQERCGEQHQTVVVGSSPSPQLSFVFDEKRQSILENDPPRHAQPYGLDRGLGQKREQLNLPVVTESHPAPATAPVSN